MNAGGAATSISIASAAAGLYVTQHVRLASTIEFPDISADDYYAILKSCVEDFNGQEPVMAAVRRPIDIAYRGNLQFTVSWRGRGGGYSLGDNTYIEAVMLRMRIVRDFRMPKLVMADLEVSDARRAKWESLDSTPANELFKPFDGEQRILLDSYMDKLASHLTECVRAQVARAKS